VAGAGCRGVDSTQPHDQPIRDITVFKGTVAVPKTFSLIAILVTTFLLFGCNETYEETVVNVDGSELLVYQKLNDPRLSESQSKRIEGSIQRALSGKSFSVVDILEVANSDLNIGGERARMFTVCGVLSVANEGTYNFMYLEGVRTPRPVLGVFIDTDECAVLWTKKEIKYSYQQ